MELLMIDGGSPEQLPEQRVGAAMRSARMSARIGLRKMAKLVGYNSHSQLHEYETGSKMPSDKIVRLYEQVLGIDDESLQSVLEDARIERHGDPFSRRRAHLPMRLEPASLDHAATKRFSHVSEGSDEPAPPANHVFVARAFRWKRYALLVLVLVTATVAVLWSARQAGDQVPPVAVDGSDPEVLGCGRDAETADSVKIFYPERYLAGFLELRASRHCQASWGKFIHSDALQQTPPLIVAVSVHRPADGASAPYEHTFAGQDIYGNLLMSSHTCVYAQVRLKREQSMSPLYRTACLEIR
ncbi:helix-turn-helix domain-containing protein [Acrocarpospora pleiomorpha]|nr:helix-turn-helix domain-containing protein [Acrocarpospora pleiomorpha]